MGQARVSDRTYSDATMSLTAEKRNCVEFLNVPRSYTPGDNLVVEYRWEEEFATTTRDWVGLFRVGWTSSRDYYTFEWSHVPAETDGRQSSVTFAGSRLPPEDSHFYQLCYVSRDGTVRGASAPFQFSPPGANLAAVEDLEVVEVSDADMSMMVVQRKSKVEEERLRKEVEQNQVELSSVRSSVCELKTEKESLAGRVRAMEVDRDAFRRRAEESEARARESETLVQDYQHKVEVLETKATESRETELRLEKTLERVRAQSAELMEAKSAEDRELSQMSHRIAELEAESDDLQKQTQIKESQVEDLQQLVADRSQESEKLVATVAELKQEIAAKDEEGGSLKGENAALKQEIAAKEEEGESLKGQNEMLKQELAIAHQNLAELVGAREMLQQVHSPPPPEGMVDRSAYDALLQGYETMEGYYQKSRQEAESFRAQLLEAQANAHSLKGRYDELVERLDLARKEYETKAGECIELRRQLKSNSKAPADETDTLILRNRVQELETQEQELVLNCQTAVQEITARNEERKQLQLRIESLESELELVSREKEEQKLAESQARRQIAHDEQVAMAQVLQADMEGAQAELLRCREESTRLLKEKDREIQEKKASQEVQQNALDEQIALVQSLQSEVERLKLAHEQFQDKSDRRIAEKNEELQPLRIALEEKTGELEALKLDLDRAKRDRARLEHNCKQLKSHLDGLRAGTGGGEGSARTCPICDTKFPGRMDQEEFEQHVQSHFTD